jgi:hypothetical protein
MPRKGKRKPELKVVFDTSVLFSQVAYDLVTTEVTQLIKNNSQHADLEVRWYIPSVVVEERRYQMRTKALELLPSVEKLERLLGHNLNVTEDILKHRIDEAIARQLSELGVSKLDIDTGSVDWNALIQRATHRQPPFQPGEKEKGFRDSLIAETFLQLVGRSAATPSLCRLAIVTGDDLLAAYVKDSTKRAKNVRVLRSTSELESLINTLVSEVTEEFVSELREKASKYFFEEGNESGLVYKEHILDKIKEKYGQELSAIPKEGLVRENGNWLVLDPRFVKKERQRIFWVTQINVEAKLSRYEHRGVVSAFPPSLNLPRAAVQGPYAWETLSAIPSAFANTVEVADGQSSFEVDWSVNVTQRKKLSSTSIDQIRFVSTKWGTE